MRQDIEELIRQFAANVLLLALRVRFVLWVQGLCLVGLEVDLNRVHSVNTFSVPRRLILKQRSKEFTQLLVFTDVLEEVCGHEFIVQNQHGEV